MDKTPIRWMWANTDSLAESPELDYVKFDCVNQTGESVYFATLVMAALLAATTLNSCNNAKTR